MIDPGSMFALLMLGLFGALLLFALWLALTKSKREAMQSHGGFVTDPGTHIDADHASFGASHSGCDAGGSTGGDGGACH